MQLLGEKPLGHPAAQLVQPVPGKPFHDTVSETCIGQQCLPSLWLGDEPVQPEEGKCRGGACISGQQRQGGTRVMMK